MPTDELKINDVERRQGLLPDDGWMWSYPGGKSKIIYMHFTHANTLTVIFPTLGNLVSGFPPLFLAATCQFDMLMGLPAK